IIPTAGLGTRFLPLSKVLPKEFFPLVDKPVLEYIIREIKESGIKKLIFITQSRKKIVFDYCLLKNNLQIKKELKKRNKNSILAEFKNWEKLFKNLSLFQVIQKKLLGDGHAILQAKNLTKKQPIAVSFADDVVVSKTPCLAQLIKVFKKYKNPVLALHRVPRKDISCYGAVSVEKIGKKTYKIKKIIEKPSQKKIPSNLAIVGKYILTPEVFDYLSKAGLEKNKEILLAEILQKMINDGKDIYGYEFEGTWLECGNKLAYLKSNLYLSLKHPLFGKKLKKSLRKQRF
ncbi:UTP--glucose-1-phosphate uridylyltransferase, partial [Patescibacteria group bacterium]